MHEQAFNWVAHHVERLGPFDSVVEIGSYNINGSIRPLFKDAAYVGLDLQAGPEVDVVGDAAEYDPPDPVSCVVCCETLEHAENWRELVRAGIEWLDEDGVFIVTCAGPGRRPHSAVDGSYNVRDHEHYANVSVAELTHALVPDFIEKQTTSLGLQIRQFGEDTQAVAIRNA